MTVKMSSAGLAKLRGREGCRLTAYLDSVGVPTIGVGHTGRMSGSPVRMGTTITQAQADAFLAADLTPLETALSAALKVSVGVNEADALLSLGFNIGTKGLVNSTVLRRLNAGDRKGAADAFLMWNKPPELIGRRKTERAQFMLPDAHAVGPTPTVPLTVNHTWWEWLLKPLGEAPIKTA